MLLTSAATNTTSLKLPIVLSESSGLATSKVFGRVIGRSPSDFEYRPPQIESSVPLRVNSHVFNSCTVLQKAPPPEK